MSADYSCTIVGCKLIKIQSRENKVFLMGRKKKPQTQQLLTNFSRTKELMMKSILFRLLLPGIYQSTIILLVLKKQHLPVFLFSPRCSLFLFGSLFVKVFSNDCSSLFKKCCLKVAYFTFPNSSTVQKFDLKQRKNFGCWIDK